MLAAAIPYILQGASALGGLFGKKKKYVDQEYLRTHFGPEAIAARAQELSQRILASPYGTQLMASAAESGQGLQTEMARRAAESGLSPDTGGQSAASDFATSAASQAQGAFERGAKSNIFQSALPIAQQLVASEQGNFLANQDAQNATPSTWQRVGQAAGAAASLFPGTPPQAGAGAAAAPVSHLALPNALVQSGMGAAAGPVSAIVPPNTGSSFETGNERRFGASPVMARIMSSRSPNMMAVRKRPSAFNFGGV